MDLTDPRNRINLSQMLGNLGGAVFWQSHPSQPAANSNTPYYPSQATMLRNALQGHLATIDALQNSLANSTDPSLSDTLRTHLAITSANAQALRARLQAATTPTFASPPQAPPLAPSPQGMTGLLNSPPPGPSAAMPLMSPTMVTRPGSGGLFNEEDYLQRQRENLQPPGQGD
jgi:hypothetical protein